MWQSATERPKTSPTGVDALVTASLLPRYGEPPSDCAASPARLPTARSSSPHAGARPRRPSRAWLRFFDFYLSLYVFHRFRALRLTHPERFPLSARPLIVCINHPSWWDPLTSILLSRYLLYGADHYAPIDAVSLGRYSILARLGLFPVEQATPRGAVQFLRGAQHILSDPNSLLWLTPQGGFTDVRSRPVAFKSGLGSLIKRLDRVTVVPLAYEYTFWNHKLPEILTNCGEPLVFERGRLADFPGMPGATADPGEIIAQALASTADELATLALTRDPARFHTLMGGDHAPMWRRLWAAARKPHSPRPRG